MMRNWLLLAMGLSDTFNHKTWFCLRIPDFMTGIFKPCMQRVLNLFVCQGMLFLLVQMVGNNGLNQIFKQIFTSTSGKLLHKATLL